jgi:protein-disulfide isomerase
MPPVPKPPPAKGGRNRNLLIAIVAAGLVAVALIAGSLLFTRESGNDAVATTGITPTDTTSTDTTSTDTTATDTTATSDSVVAGIPQQATVLGKPQAPVRLLQFEDLQCPICKKYMDDVFPAIVDEYVKPGLVKIDFRGIAFLGPDSDKALRIAVASGFQNKLWDVVELFYERQGVENSGWVTDQQIDEILAEVPGLNVAKVKRDAQSAAVRKEIAAVQAEAVALQVPGTPWFYIGIGLNQPYEIRPRSLTPSEFRPALDQALNR